MPDATNSHRAYSVWQMLATAFSVAISPNALFFATCGLLLSTASWQLAGGIFGITQSSTATLGSATSGSTAPALITSATRVLNIDPASVPIDPIVGVPCSIVEPFVRVFETGQSWSHLGYSVLGGIATLAVWSFFGLAISRIAMLRCGMDARLSLRDAAKFATRKWTAVLGAPLATLLAIVAIALPVHAISWLVRFDIGMFLVACVWLVVVAFGLLMCVLAIGLMFGWPLMWSSIAAEDSGLFDAISRSYAYTYQRPIHYLFYASIAAGLGLLGWLLACFATETVIDLAYWTIQFGGGAERVELLRSLVRSSTETESGLLAFSGRIVGVTNWIVRMVAGAFSYSFFWSASAAIYLMLRFETDETLTDDIVVDDRSATEPPETSAQGDTDPEAVTAEREASEASAS